MQGYQIDYKIKKGMSSRFNQKMFGRISSRKTDDKSYNYYIPGILDNVSHYRIFEGRIFLGTVDSADFDPVMPYVNEFNVGSTSKEEKNVHMRTGREKWRFHANEKRIEVDNL